MTRKRHKFYDMSQLVLFEGKHTVQTSHCALWLSCGMRFVQGSSFKISPPADEEEHDADTDIGEHHAHPDLHAQRVHEGEDAGPLLDGLLDHDGDADGHEGLGEVRDLLPLGVDGERGDGDLCLPADELPHHS